MKSTTGNMSILLIFLVSCLYIFSGIVAVRIKVTSSITAALNQPEVILPCRYSLDQPDGEHRILWRVNNRRILWRNSQGKLQIPINDSRRVRLADGCSLVLKNLSLKDTGKYRVSILAPLDTQRLVNAVVNLVVTLQSTTVKNETQPILAETSTKKEYNITSESNGTRLEEEPGFLVHLTNVATPLLCFALHGYVFFTVNDLSFEKDESEPERKIRLYHAIMSNLLIVLLTAVFVNTMFLRAVWNTIAQIVLSIWMGILSIIIIVAAVMKYRIKRKLQ